MPIGLLQLWSKTAKVVFFAIIYLMNIIKRIYTLKNNYVWAQKFYNTIKYFSPQFSLEVTGDNPYVKGFKKNQFIQASLNLFNVLA